MKDNEMSFEALYSEALGISNVSNNVVISNESYDGFDDALEVEIARSFENLAFLDTYSAMQQKNSAEMIRMCKKLSVNYGLKSGVNEKAANSIESLCVQSTEDEKKDGEKKEGVFKRIAAAIKNIFLKVAEFFINIWEKIKQFFIVKLGKIDRDLTPEEMKAVINNDKLWEGKPYAIISGNVDMTQFQKTIEACQVVEKLYKTMATTSDVNKLNKANSEIDRKNVELKDSLHAKVNSYDIQEVSDGNKRKLAVEWAGKAENLKKSVDAIKNTEQFIKSVTSISRSAAKHADDIEKGKWMVFGTKEVNGGAVIDNDIKQNTINTFRNFAKRQNDIRLAFMGVVKTIVFAKKIYNIGKRSYKKNKEEK